MKPIEPMEPMPASTIEKIKNNYIVQAWLVLLLSLFFGGGLAGMQFKLGPIIEENKINETRQRVPELLFSSEELQKMSEQKQTLVVEPTSITVEKQGRSIIYNVYGAKFASGDCAGWVVKTSGQGYADKIELLIGLDPKAESITGLFVLEQKETPGLGNKITTDKWRSQFLAKKTDSGLVVTKTGAKSPYEIDAITGATISSRSVCTLINNAIQDLKVRLAEKSKG